MTPIYVYPFEEEVPAHGEDVKKTSWKNMPPTTAVGFRGPMVRVADLKRLPDFYIYEEFL